MKNLDHITNLKQLLRVTIDDVKLVKGDDRYVFDVTEYHTPYLNKCAVCLAGSITAKTLGVDINITVRAGYFDNRTEVLLLLIDRLSMREDSIYLQNLLDNCDVEFDLNNLSELDLDNYDLVWGDVDKWEKLYSDLV